MTPDEQYAASVRYAAVPVCLVRCPSGMIAITEGLNTRFRQVIAILPEADVIPFILDLRPPAPEPPPRLVQPLPPDLEFDI